MKRITLFLLLHFPLLALAQDNITWPVHKLEVDGHDIRPDVKTYVYHSHELPRRDSTQFGGWIAGPVDYKVLPIFKSVNRDTLVLELMVEHYFWYDQFRNRTVAYRYVPYDDYPANISRGDLKAIFRRLERLERKP